MSTLSEKDLELRDRLYDRLICGEDWELLAEMLDGHMQYPVALLAAYVYCTPKLSHLETEQILRGFNSTIVGLIEEYIRDWEPAEREPTAGEIMGYEELRR